MNAISLCEYNVLASRISLFSFFFPSCYIYRRLLTVISFCFSPKIHQSEKNLQTLSDTRSSVKEKGQANQAFEEYTSCSSDSPVLRNDGISLQIPPQVFPSYNLAYTASDEAFIVDDTPQKSDQISTSPNVFAPSSSSTYGSSNGIGMMGQLSGTVPCITKSEFEPYTLPKQIRRPNPALVCCNSLPPYPNHICQQKAQPPMIIVNSGCDSTAPLYLSLLDQVVVGDIENETHITRM